MGWPINRVGYTVRPAPKQKGRHLVIVAPGKMMEKRPVATRSSRSFESGRRPEPAMGWMSALSALLVKQAGVEWK